MRHRVKKVQFKKGKDATKSTLRKLALNFIKHGKIKTSVKKAKALRRLIDRLVYKAKERKESNKNILLKHLGDKEVVQRLFEKVAPVFKDRSGGFVKIKRLGARLGDATEMAQVEWVKPVIEVDGEKITPTKSKSKVKSNEKDKTGSRNETADKKKQKPAREKNKVVGKTRKKQLNQSTKKI